MTEIPDDIMKEATKVCHRNDFASRRYNGMPSDVCLMVATAIHAERERCAKLCETTAMCVPYSGTVQTHGRYVPDEAIDAFHQGAGYAALIRDADFRRQNP